MKYIIINSENFADIEKVQESARVEIMKRYAVDQFDNYAHGDFAVMGEKALQMFREKYGYKLDGDRDEMKTDGKTRAKFIPYISISYYYDARDGGRGGLTNIYDRQNIGLLVEFDGVLMYSYNFDRKGAARGFYLFNDQTDYNKYLPYNWENENPKPNYVGTMTDKKAAAWVEWLRARKATADSEKARREGKVSAFLEKVRGFDTSKCKDFRISDKSGYFVRNGLRYTYEISDAGTISENIRVDSSYLMESRLDAFSKMAEGNY